MLRKRTLSSRSLRLAKTIQSYANLVWYYPLNESTGRTASNKAPLNINTYDGTIITTTMPGQEGKVGSSYLLTGVGYVNTNYAPVIPTSQSWSVFALIKLPTTAAATEKCILGMLNTGAGVSEFVIEFKVGKPYIYFSDSAGGFGFVDSAPTDLRDGKFHTWLIVRNAVADTLTVYIDNRLESQVSEAATATCTCINLFIGARNNDGTPDRNEAFYIQHAAFFNQALTLADAAKLAAIAGTI